MHLLIISTTEYVLFLNFLKWCSNMYVFLISRNITTLPFLMRRDSQCDPVCLSGCGPHGACASPDNCSCALGYVGPTCGVPCACNGHSDCIDATVTGRATCLNCLHNTQVWRYHAYLPDYMSMQSVCRPHKKCSGFPNNYYLSIIRRSGFIFFAPLMVWWLFALIWR